MNSRKPLVLLLAAAVTTPAAVAEGATYYYDPGQPYLDVNDSPFSSMLSSDAGTFWLEDFEDGLLNTLGVSGTYDGEILGPSNWTDSVDGDGALDGSGNDGSSLWIYNGENPGATFTFDGEVLGALPTMAGLVWTDGHSGASVTFEAWDAGGNLIGSMTELVGDEALQGTTDEDRFFGVAHDSGISAIRIFRDGGTGGFEMDHLQFGYAGQVIPLPPAVGLGLAGLGLLAARRRRAARAFA